MRRHSHSRQLSDPLPGTDALESSFPSSNSRSLRHFFGTKPPSLSHQNRTTTPCCLSRSCSTSCFGLKPRFSTMSAMEYARSQGRAMAMEHSAVRKKNVSVQQKKLDLEQEVDSLHKMLDYEEKVHLVLEGALQPNAGSTLSIPSFLPKKAKELLAELVMVEEEIARLEGQISKIQQDLKEAKDVQKALESHQYKPISGCIAPFPHQTSSITRTASERKGMQEEQALDTKPMFFINQAIKGSYTFHGFKSKEHIGNISGGTTDKKEGQRLSGLQGASRKSGLIIEKASSPRPPRHSAIREISFNFSKEPLSDSSSSEKGNQKWQPNKLSEGIMKCLVCIYVRLVRTSRTVELEKSNNVTSRSINLSSLSSRSFRSESGLNPKASLAFQREAARQDPYGIFEIEDSLVRDIGPYKNLVRFTSSSLDVKGISCSVSLLRQLRDLMNSLQDLDLRFMTHQQKLAFWINMFNTCIMHGFLEHGLPSSPEKVLALRNKAVLNIGGNKLNALAIEQFILRRPSKLKQVHWKAENNDQEDAVRSIYGLEHPEPNIAFALCLGSRSSPAVRIYTAEGASAELEKAKLEYLQASIVVTAARRLMIPKLLLWNMHEGFASDLDSLVEWICNQLPASGSLRKSLSECLRAHGNEKVSDIVDVIPHEFDFQYLLFM